MQITDLYQTKITCSTYNANIDSTDTVITVKLIDFNGAAVTNKSVTLTCDKGYFNKNGSTPISGTSTKSITATTDSSGEITATWTASEWGLCTFSTNTTNTQIKVNEKQLIIQQVNMPVSTVASGSTSSGNLTVPACPTGYSSFFASIGGGWLNVVGWSLNGTQLTIDVANAGTSAHSGLIRGTLIYYKSQSF